MLRVLAGMLAGVLVTALVFVVVPHEPASQACDEVVTLGDELIQLAGDGFRNVADFMSAMQSDNIVSAERSLEGIGDILDRVDAIAPAYDAAYAECRK